MKLKRLFKWLFNIPDRCLSIDYHNGKYCNVSSLRYPRTGIIKITNVSHEEPNINGGRYDYIIQDDMNSLTQEEVR